MLHASPWWSIVVPDQWQVDQDEDCTSLTDPAGVGALQISAARKDAGAVTAADLDEFAADDWKATGAPKVPWKGYFTGFSIEFVNDRHFWRKWWLAAGNTLVFVTYNCATAKRGSEEQVAVDMVGTLRPRTVGG